MKTVLSLSLLVALIVGKAHAEDPQKVENFTLEDVVGKKHSLTDYKEAKAVVIMFIATQCPVSNAYNDRMSALAKEYSAKGVVFLGINSNKQESVDEIKQHSADHGFSFPVLKDHKNIVADKFGATVTPEIYVVNGSLDLLYHGRIDDSQRESRITSRDLRVALDAHLDGKPVPVKKTKAFGCTIKRV